jgi:hypothetical protein
MARKPFNATVRLAFETLGNREAPSGLFVVGYGEPNLVPFAVEEQAAVAANQAPRITDFRAVVGPDGQVTFAGTVSDDQAVEGTTVHIVGRGVDVTAVVLHDGTFRVTTVVDVSGDITVTATATDRDGATSDPAYTTFSPSN